MPIQKDETSFLFEVPNFEELPKDVDKEALLDEIGEYLVASILDYVGEAKSPVAGGRYKAQLSEAYADAQKMGDRTANLELYGPMLDALQVIPDYENGVLAIGIFQADQAIKSYNHNTGDTLPKRQFIPDEGESLKAEIIRGVGRIIEDYLDE